MNRLIFLSYARADSAFALRLAKDLRAAGVEIWIDQLDIRAGDTWDRAVEVALQRCSHLLVILSPAAVASRPVLDEVSFALEENKTTVPVLFQPCEIPFRLRRIQRTDFTSDYPAALQRLVGELGVSAVGNAAQEPVAIEPGTESDDAHEPGTRVTRKQRLLTALWAGLAGSVISAILAVFIYANDPRFDGTHSGLDLRNALLLSGGFAGVLWAIVGLITGPRTRTLLAAIGGSIAALILWIAVGGTYQDVLMAGVNVGLPIGGIAGATIQRFIEKRRSGATRLAGA
jgi:hypothetical protein